MITGCIRRSILLLAMLALGAEPLRAQSRADTPVFRTSGAFFALSVPDLEAARAWYADKLGLTVTMRAPAHEGAQVLVLEGGGLIVELIHNPAATAHPPAANPTLRHGFFKAGLVVEEFDATLTRLRDRGVEIAMGPFPARGGQRANFVIRDNSGNAIQFFAAR